MKKYTRFLHEIDELIDIGFLHYEGGSFDPEETTSNPFLHIRWISLRSQKTLHELDQILLLAQDAVVFRSKKETIYNTMQSLLTYLR
jgi:hypothetical protein